MSTLSLSPVYSVCAAILRGVDSNTIHSGARSPSRYNKNSIINSGSRSIEPRRDAPAVPAFRDLEPPRLSRFRDDGRPHRRPPGDQCSKVQLDQCAACRGRRRPRSARGAPLAPRPGTYRYPRPDFTTTSLRVRSSGFVLAYTVRWRGAVPRRAAALVWSEHGGAAWSHILTFDDTTIDERTINISSREVHKAVTLQAVSDPILLVLGGPFVPFRVPVSTPAAARSRFRSIAIHVHAPPRAQRHRMPVAASTWPRPRDPVVDAATAARHAAAGPHGTQ